MVNDCRLICGAISYNNIVIIINYLWRVSAVVSATALRCRCSCFGYCRSIKLMSGWNGRNNAVVKTTSKHWLLEKTLFITNRKWPMYKLKEYIWASWVCTPLRSRALVNTRRDYKLALARNNATIVNVRYIKIQDDSESYWLFMFIHFLCLCSLRLNIMLNFNISKVVYYSLQKQPLQTVNYALLKAAREFVLFQQQVQF